MNRFIHAIIATVLSAQCAAGAGFSDSHITFYGEVRQVGGAGTILLQAGELEITFANQLDPDNRVSLKTHLRPTGRSGSATPFSYSLRVSLAYLPDGFRKSTSLSISSRESRFEIESVTIDGEPATLPDGSLEFFDLSFASRASHHRLDLIVQGDSLDSDGDGLPDWWERSHGLNPDSPDSSADPDGDGWSNLDEFKRGADPNSSNREPLIVDSEIKIPESGVAGIVIDVLDSDTLAAAQDLRLAPPSNSGFELRLDGEAITSTIDLTLADLQSGRVTAADTDPAMEQAVVEIELDRPNQLILRSAKPSHTDGSDASLWLDAAELAPETAVDRWNDRSGNSRHAFQPTPNHQPTANHEGIDFSAPTAHLFFQDSALPDGDHTVLASFSTPDATGPEQTIFATNRGHFELAPTDTPISYPGAPVYQTGGQALHGFESAVGATRHTSVFRREGTVLQQAFGLSFDGESRTPSQSQPLLPAIGARRLGAPVGGETVAAPFGGTLHEILIFPTALAEQKLRDVHDYLESKWSGAVIWDFSTRLRPIRVAISGDGQNIVRGGHGDDEFTGSEGADIISGGPGDDLLRGLGGADLFMFGGVDHGTDTIDEFELDTDTIDLSAHFWNMKGDARQFISVRLETNFSTDIPTLDSVLVITIPSGETREIILRNRVVGVEQLVQLIVEGRIRMGGLSIPSSVQLARTGPHQTIREQLGESFQIEITRSGDANAAALEVPIGYFREALGDDLVIEEAQSDRGPRSLIAFARGETSKLLNVRPLHDLHTEGTELWELAVLPHFRYSINQGEPITQAVTDVPLVWLEVVEREAIASTGQPAEIRVHRDGDLADALSVTLTSTPDDFGTSLEILPQQSYASLQISAGDVSVPRTVIVDIADSQEYQRATPAQAAIWLTPDPESLDGLGFDRWLTTRSGGEFRSLAALPNHQVSAMIRNYALDDRRQLKFRLVDGRPELTLDGRRRPDLRWKLQSTTSLASWNPRTDFTELPHTELTFLGEPLHPNEDREFFRMVPELTTAAIATNQIAKLVGNAPTANFGATWVANPIEGALTTDADSRIASVVEGGTLLDFEMAVSGSGTLVFKVAGREVARTEGGAPIHVRRELTSGSNHSITWEFARGETGGSATIRTHDAP